MRIELRILSGARAGQSEVFEQRAILIGRKPSNDLRFDLHGDLDVSANHAEIVEEAGQWYVVDRGSTNGTYLNGTSVRAKTSIKDGDIIAFGKNGPTVEVRAKGDATGKTPAIPRTTSRKTVRDAAGQPARMSTHERVAVAVREQTRGIKTMLFGSMIGLGALAVIAYWIGTRDGGKQVAEMQRSLAQAESTSMALRHRVSTDTVLAQAISRQTDSFRVKAEQAATQGSSERVAAITQEIQQHTARQQGLIAMDMPAIHRANDAAVAFLFTEIDGEQYGGTAFGITKSGLLVTNRHNVRSSSTGSATTKLWVQFANTTTHLSARVVKVPEGDEPDLALIQIERAGEYPTVTGISALGDVPVGAALVTIGYPLSLSLPMDGDAMTTTLQPGTASKRIPGLLQIDAFGAHGMSGSPVFDNRGLVVGTIYGGPKDSPQIIYAVPSDRIAAFLGDVGKSIVR